MAKSQSLDQRPLPFNYHSFSWCYEKRMRRGKACGGDMKRLPAGKRGSCANTTYMFQEFPGFHQHQNHIKLRILMWIRFRTVFFRAPQELSGHHANNVVICFCPVYLLDLGDPGIYDTCVCVELYIILCVFCNPCICMHISMSFRTNLNQFPLMDPFRDTERLGTTFLCSWALSLLENQTFKGRWSLYNILQVVLWPNHQRVWWLESHQVPRPGVHWSGIWSCHIKRVAGAAWVFR
jgi:hypothetical protein